MRLSHLNESDHTNPPIRVITTHGTTHEVLKVVESDGWTLVLTRAITPIKKAHGTTYYYNVFAFKWIEGIGGRMVCQWDTALIMDTFFDLNSAENGLSTCLNKCASMGSPGTFVAYALKASDGLRVEW